MSRKTQNLIIAFLAVLFLAMPQCAEAIRKENNNLILTDGFELWMQLFRKDPAPDALFLNFGGNEFVCHTSASNSFKLFIEKIPEDIQVVAISLFPSAIQKTKEIILEKDAIASNCRWCFANCNPNLALMLRYSENRHLYDYAWLNVEKDDWQKTLAEFLAAEKASNGKLFVETRLIYALGFEKLNPKNPMYSTLEYLDNNIDTYEYLLSSFPATKPLYDHLRATDELKSSAWENPSLWHNQCEEARLSAEYV